MSNLTKNVLPVSVLRFKYIPKVFRWRYSHASTPSWRFYWNPEPGAWLISHCTKIMLDPEVAVLIPPNTPFATGLDQPFAHFFVHFNFDRDELIPEQRMIRKLDAGSIILPYIRKNLSTMSERQLCWAASSIVSAALLQLPPEAFNAGDYQEEHNFFNRAVRLMEDDPAFALTAGELAEQCGTSVNTLQRQFLSATGLSIRKWLLNRKMENAVQLLTVRKFSIKETAYELGFADRYHFSKVFKQYFGITPANFVKSGGIPLP